MIKELLQGLAIKYNVTIQSGENSAEYTGFTGTKWEIGGSKANLRSDIEELLIAQGYTEFKTTSGVNPDKISVEWKE